VGDGVIMGSKVGDTPKVIDLEGIHNISKVGEWVDTGVGCDVVNDSSAHQSVFDLSKPRHPGTVLLRAPFL
jgi:hypothetical protein